MIPSFIRALWGDSDEDRAILEERGEDREFFYSGIAKAMREREELRQAALNSKEER